MGSMIDCRWMQVYEHTKWNQGSTGWLVSRIELMTEDCRSEMNSAKITNHTDYLQQPEIHPWADDSGVGHNLENDRIETQDSGLDTDFRSTVK